MTVLMKLGAELSSNLEMFTMPEFMPFLHHVHSQSKQDGTAWEAAELDLEDMYLNIPKAQLPDAFQYLLQKIEATPYVWGRSRRAHVSKETKCNCNHYFPIPLSMRF